MDVNKAVIDELDGLDFERQLLFAFGCVDRCLDLYRLFTKRGQRTFPFETCCGLERLGEMFSDPFLIGAPTVGV